MIILASQPSQSLSKYQYTEIILPRCYVCVHMRAYLSDIKLGVN
jgi:hypothetical protein